MLINRKDGRSADEIRPLTLTRNCMSHAEGSCLVEWGNTRVITTASVDQSVPPWLIGKGTGWITAEYGMLPRSTHTRNKRAATALQQNGRTMEIQRLIGRSLRAITDFAKLGERTVYIDCDVLNADGGTRVASIVGAAVSLHDADAWLVKNGMIPVSAMNGLVAGVSAGISKGTVLVDLCYEEDSSADVDMNIVMTDAGGLVEVQGTAERRIFDRNQLDALLQVSETAIRKIIEIQKKALELI
ncbi:MAG: ribonuclease PH [Candidatus Latescibacterota bacterium]|jgi:ribonuclease PH